MACAVSRSSSEGLGARSQGILRGVDVGDLLGVDPVDVALFPARAGDGRVGAGQPDPQVTVGWVCRGQGRHRHGGTCTVHRLPQCLCGLAEGIFVDNGCRA